MFQFWIDLNVRRTLREVPRRGRGGTERGLQPTMEAKGLPIRINMLMSDRSAVRLAAAIGGAIGRLQGVRP